MKRGVALLVILALALAALAAWWADREYDLLPTRAEGPAEPVTAAALDTLRGVRGAYVSLAGRVEQQGDDGAIVLHDGTGVVLVQLPEALPPLIGRGLAVTGWVRGGRSEPLTVEAHDWMYDSTAAGVHSE